MFGRFFAKKPAPLTGAPTVRRLKSYSSQTGHVYQYFYLGQRPFERGEGVEFCFEASSDRKTWIVVPVRVGRQAVRDWELRQGRELGSNEWYAIAKMALFQAFDERPPGRMTAEVEVRAGDVESILRTLDLE